MNRFEKKYTYLGADQNEIISILLSRGFYEVYETRLISSIYYDDNNFSLFNESIDGVGFRKKFRIRLYNNDAKTLFLESKVRENDTGFKITSDLKTSEKKININYKDIFRNCICNFEIPCSVEYIYLPVAAVTYYRKYFANYINKDFRVTLDSSIAFGRCIFKDLNNISILINMPFERNVLEIKYPKELELIPSDLVKNLSYLHLQNERNSKYCNCIESLY